MIGAPNTQGQKYWVGIVQWAPKTLVSEEIADIFRNYNIDGLVEDCSNSSASALELLQSCTKPSICYLYHNKKENNKHIGDYISFLPWLQ